MFLDHLQAHKLSLRQAAINVFFFKQMSPSIRIIRNDTSHYCLEQQELYIQMLSHYFHPCFPSILQAQTTKNPLLEVAPFPSGTLLNGNPSNREREQQLDTFSMDTSYSNLTTASRMNRMTFQDLDSRSSCMVHRQGANVCCSWKANGQDEFAGFRCFILLALGSH